MHFGSKPEKCMRDDGRPCNHGCAFHICKVRYDTRRIVARYQKSSCILGERVSSHSLLIQIGTTEKLPYQLPIGFTHSDEGRVVNWGWRGLFRS